jgi:hypothetical protein
MSIRNVVSYIHVCDCILQVAVQNLTEEEREEKERKQKHVVMMLKWDPGWSVQSSLSGRAGVLCTVANGLS